MKRWLLNSIAGGGCATLLMDIGSFVGRALGLTAGAPPRIIAKWFMYVLRGRLLHDNIVSSPEIPIYMPLMLAIHYGIGIVLAGLFAAMCSWREPKRGVFLLAVGYGLVTSVFAWFLMFPAMGWGIAGTRGPEEYHLTRTSLVNHAAYGLGLALWTCCLAPRMIRSKA